MKQGRDEFKAMHDLVLATRPGLEHQPCALCATTEELTMTTYTEDEFRAALETAVSDQVAAAVAAATQPLQAELDTLRQAQGANELEAAVATATAELQASLADTQAQLETAQAEATAAREALEANLAEAAAQAEAAAIEACKAERVQAVKDLNIWPDEFIDGKADEFARLTDEDWTSRFEELEQLRDTARSSVTTLPQRRSAFVATAPADAKTPTSAVSAVLRRRREVLNATSGN